MHKRKLLPMFKKILAILLIIAINAPAFTWAADYNQYETNPLLGSNPVLMDAQVCAQKYGVQFCSCSELESGEYACFYKKPAAGPYGSKGSCEKIWGEGGCEDKKDGLWFAKKEPSTTPTTCSGDVYIYSGKKYECHKQGLKSPFQNCCGSAADDGCSEDDVAELLGIDSAVLAGAKVLTEHLAESHFVNYASPHFSGVSEALYGNLVGSNSEFLSSSASRMFMDGMNLDGTLGSIADSVSGASKTMVNAGAEAYADALASGASVQQAQTAASNAVLDVGGTQTEAVNVSNELSSSVGDGMGAMQNAMASAAWSGVVSVGFSLMAGDLSPEALADALMASSVAFMGNFVPGIGWAYMAFQLLNSMLNAECRVGEKLLFCKKEGDFCTYVETYCSARFLSICLQRKSVYCCFNSKLARIVNEQGRPQVGRGWSRKSGRDDCRGFTLNEFARLRFDRMDLGEFYSDIQRRMNTDIEGQMDKVMDRFEMQGHGL